jgi:hypothetical protein
VTTVHKFVAEQNIHNFRASLARETDAERRAMLERLIAEEEAKLVKERARAPYPSDNQH